jgi:hypothetical protein
MTPEELFERLTETVHEQTQVGDRGVDLTAARVLEVVRPGRVDFGGEELSSAGVTACRRRFRDPEDDYGWWTLTAGTYLLEFNESLTGSAPVRVEPGRALLDRGATHPTVTTDELRRLPLSVGGAGLELKENARVSTVYPVA